MSVEQKVQKHFDGDATRFDAIYEEGKKGILARWIDNVWRGVVRRRLDLTLDKLSPLDGKTVLDVGCGSGRFCIAYARHGAERVVGVDFAPAMIRIAQDMAEQAGLQDVCEFRVGTFPDVVPDGPFDAATALGVLDYVADPVALIRNMAARTRKTLVLSFPKAWEWRVPVRRVRFWWNGCPLFLYSAKKVRAILAEADVASYDWIVLDRDFVVVAHLQER
jgi:2-polyprenyl-3-methyl-5-hydroxy-6-metoxy-1,4-benzoquinol methylase